MSTAPLWAWLGFGIFILAMLALDLGVFHRKEHVLGLREAIAWVCTWVSLALLFGLALLRFEGRETALQFVTGYLIEQSLSVDNLFIFVLVFGSFRVPEVSQHRVLFWGILGALVMRLTLIVAGSALVMRFHWVLYVFGAFLVVTGLRMMRETEGEPDVQSRWPVRLARRWIQVTDDYEGSRFLVRRDARLVATPLLLVLVVVEITDLIFALDSIPAIFAVTTDPFIIFTSNVFAILGLRSLYFVIAKAIGSLHYLRVALSGILVFVGFKMLMAYRFKIPTLASLGVIATLLVAAVLASLWRARRLRQRAEAD